MKQKIIAVSIPSRPERDWIRDRFIDGSLLYNPHFITPESIGLTMTIQKKRKIDPNAPQIIVVEIGNGQLPPPGKKIISDRWWARRLRNAYNNLSRHQKDLRKTS